MLSIMVLGVEVALLSLFEALGIIERPLGFITVLIVLFSVAYMVDLDNNPELHAVKTPLFLGYILRLALLYFDIYGRNIFVLPNSGSDAIAFYNNALSILNGNTLEVRRGYFVIVLVALFKLVGVSKLYVQFLLVLCSVVSLHLCDKALRVYRIDDSIRYHTMMIICLLPNFAILSSVMLRESIVTMLVSISLYCFVKWSDQKNEVWFWVAVVFVFMAMRFHSGTISVLLGYWVSRVIYNKKTDRISITIGNFIPTLILILVSLFIVNKYGSLFMGKFLRVEGLEDIANVRDAAGSSYAKYVGNSDTIANMLIFTPIRLLFFILSPMPFQWRGVSDVLAFMFSSLFYGFVIIKTFLFMIKNKSRNKAVITMLFMIAFISMFVFCWGVSSSGTALRHRDKMVVLYGILLGLTSEVDNYPIDNVLNGDETPSYKKYIR